MDWMVIETCFRAFHLQVQKFETYAEIYEFLSKKYEELGRRGLFM